LRWIGNPTDAEDIVQVTFEDAFITLDNYPVQIIRALNLRPWLYKVTLNVSRNYISRTKLHTISLDLLEDGDLIEQDEDWQNQPELVVESTERRRELEALVATLAPSYRDGDHAVQYRILHRYPRRGCYASYAWHCSPAGVSSLAIWWVSSRILSN
jgi:RNA polymerase sigma factor (sigma-70 family)